MEFSVATVTLKSFSPYSQSKQHDDPSLKSEAKGDYDKRTWLSKAHFTDKGTLGIPAASLTQAIAEAAKYSKKQIPGQGKATWTAKFKSGIMLVESFVDTGIKKADVGFVDIMCDAQGKTGSAVSSHVPRRFPQVPEWAATFDVWILDPIITEEILKTYSLPASTMDVNGDVIEIEAVYQTAATANGKTITLYFGATIIGNVTGAFNADTILVRARVNRIGATTQSATCTMLVFDTAAPGTLVGQSVMYTLPGETLSGAVSINFAATNAVAAAADIVSRQASIVLFQKQ